MSEAVANILAQLDSLSQPGRAEIAYAVLRSLEPEDPGAVEAWEEELGRRLARIRSGQAVAIPADQVIANWRQVLGTSTALR